MSRNVAAGWLARHLVGTGEPPLRTELKLRPYGTIQLTASNKWQRTVSMTISDYQLGPGQC